MVPGFRELASIIAIAWIGLNDLAVAQEIGSSRSAYDIPNLPFELPVTPFDEEYVAAYNNQYVVETHEVLELAVILMALDAEKKGIGRGNWYLETDYFRAVKDRFGPFLKHPIFAELANIDFTNFVNIVGFRENLAMYEFEGDNIRQHPSFDAWWPAGRAPDIAGKLVGQVEDFARVSNYREFYSSNRKLYEALSKKTSRAVPLRAIKAFLYREFPVIEYDSYRIFISPIIRGSHSGNAKFSHHFNQNLTMNAGPNPNQAFDDDAQFMLTKEIFTEIDHNYADLAMIYFLPEVAEAFKELPFWSDSEAGLYADPVSTFSEYFTWTAFLLFARDYYPSEIYIRNRNKVINQMEERRNFIRFGEFHGEVERLYDGREEGQTIAHLIPDLLIWANDVSDKLDN